VWLVFTKTIQYLHATLIDLPALHLW